MSTLMMTPIRILLGRLDKLEQKIVDHPGSTKFVADSAVRFEIMRENMRREYSGPDKRFMRFMPAIMAGMLKSLNPLKKNPPAPKKRIEEDELNALVSYLLSIGASSVGFTRVPKRFIFKNKAILHANAIVLSMEMDRKGFDIVPSVECEMAVMEIYRDLGIIANRGAAWLRKRGFSAHAGHPLMGVALYPALAQLGGLGWMGKNGLTITPEHGPRVRLGAIYTGAENLPFYEGDEHRWIEEYCETCNICAQKCPVDAIASGKVDRSGDHITFVDTERCFPQFANQYGCAICIAVCPFNKRSYNDIKKRYSANVAK
jgi:epoxyqueuosine reductase